MRRSTFLRLFLFVLALAVPSVMAHGGKAPRKGGRKDIVYVCACGDACTCGTVATKPGKCACGKGLQGGHVVEIDQDEALVCMCGVGCSCEIDSKDATKCACGKPLKRAKLKGTGLYFCNCGGTCTCNTVSSKPGKCGCGMALHKAE
jgi:hypothetical protein